MLADQQELLRHYHIQHGVSLEPDFTTQVETRNANIVNDGHAAAQQMDTEEMRVLLPSPMRGDQKLLEEPRAVESPHANVVISKLADPQLADLGQEMAPEVPLVKLNMAANAPMAKSEVVSHGSTKDSVPPIVVLDDYVPKSQIKPEGSDDGDAGEMPTTGNPVEETGKKPDDADFNFVLQAEEVKGKSLWYGRISFKCLHCDFKSRTKNRFKTHMYEKHQDMLPFHENLHASETEHDKDSTKVMKMSQYETQYCKRPRLAHGKRQRKIEKQDIPGVYPCVQCKKVFSRLRYLRKHGEIHRTEKVFICEDCGKSFKSRAYLRVHKRVHVNRVFQCNQCDFSSTMNAAIQAHRQIHNQGSVICDICGNAYTDKSTLTKHKRVHDLSRPYACNFPGCTWRFKTEIMCRAHIRAHTTEGKFKCVHCGYVFRHKHHLQRHETNMHGVPQVKSRGSQVHDIRFLENNDEVASDTISVVISRDFTEQIGLVQSDGSLSGQQLVIAKDMQDQLVNLAETTDLSNLGTPYESMIQTQDIALEQTEGKTIMVVHPEAQIVFQEN